jgi:hypothetical protein
LLLIATMAGCHAAPSAPLVAKARVAQHAAIRDTADPLAAAVQADLDVIDAKFHDLGLDTASGRKLTPERDRALIPGLATLCQQLDADMAAMTARLAAAGTPQAAAAQQLLDRYHPLAGETLVEGATATDMLYRVTQYRVKLGALLELQLRAAVS